MKYKIELTTLDDVKEFTQANVACCGLYELRDRKSVV